MLSKRIAVYMLSNAVVLYDDATTHLASSMPFRTFEKRITKVSESDIEVRKIDASSGDLTNFLTLGMFVFPGDGKGEVFFGRHGGMTGGGTLRRGTQVRRLGETMIFPYLDESGWDKRWASIVVNDILQGDIDAAISGMMFRSGLYTEEEFKQQGEKVAARLGVERFRRSVFQFESFLRQYPNQEPKFQELFETYPYLLSMWGEVVPKPFLQSAGTVAIVKDGRVSDFLVKELDGSCTLVEIESPSKPVFTDSDDPRPTQYVTEAENQVRQWDQIIRRNPQITADCPGIEYYRGRVVIGRSFHRLFPSYAAFQAELASLNEQRSRIRFETYDVLLEEARAALGFLELTFSGVPHSVR
ncbi:MAG: DUF4263 domain-containing protein [Chloroflexi bacterium]|nr:DUF4263 domain-containing protein [Chloroflexota bacterium]